MAPKSAIKVKKHKKIILHLSDNVDEVVILEISMNKKIADIIRQIRKEMKTPKDFPDDWSVFFVNMISEALQEEILYYAKHNFKGNTKIRSNMVN